MTGSREVRRRRWAGLILVVVAVVVPASMTSGRALSATLPAGGALTGTVTNGGGTRIAAVDIDAYDAATGAYVAQATSDAGGRYRLAVPVGTYKVRFVDPSGRWAKQYFDGRASSATGTAVSVTAGAEISLDARLQPGGSVTGTVTASPGEGVGAVHVDAYEASSGSFIDETVTGSTGRYTLAGLPAGSYKLRFSDPSGSRAEQWYPNTASQSAGATVTVAPGPPSTIDVVLPTGASITGTVTAAQGGQVGAIHVDAYEASSGAFIDETVAGPTGSYTLAGLPAGTYKLRFFDPAGTRAVQWFDQAASQDAAAPIRVTPGTRNILDVVLQPGGSITGTVTGGAGSAGLAGMDVNLYDAVTGAFISQAVTGTGGDYVMTGLPAGTYKLRFSDPSGIRPDRWYDNATTSSSANQVTVSASRTTTVDADITDDAPPPPQTNVIVPTPTSRPVPSRPSPPAAATNCATPCNAAPGAAGGRATSNRVAWLIWLVVALLLACGGLSGILITQKWRSRRSATAGSDLGPSS